MIPKPTTPKDVAEEDEENMTDVDNYGSYKEQHQQRPVVSLRQDDTEGNWTIVSTTHKPSSPNQTNMTYTRSSAPSRAQQQQQHQYTGHLMSHQRMLDTNRMELEYVLSTSSEMTQATLNMIIKAYEKYIKSWHDYFHAFGNGFYKPYASSSVSLPSQCLSTWRTFNWSMGGSAPQLEFQSIETELCYAEFNWACYRLYAFKTWAKSTDNRPICNFNLRDLLEDITTAMCSDGTDLEFGGVSLNVNRIIATEDITALREWKSKLMDLGALFSFIADNRFPVTERTSNNNNNNNNNIDNDKYWDFQSPCTYQMCVSLKNHCECLARSMMMIYLENTNLNTFRAPSSTTAKPITPKLTLFYQTAKKNACCFKYVSDCTKKAIATAKSIIFKDGTLSVGGKMTNSHEKRRTFDWLTLILEWTILSSLYYLRWRIAVGRILQSHITLKTGRVLSIFSDLTVLIEKYEELSKCLLPTTTNSSKQKKIGPAVFDASLFASIFEFLKDRNDKIVYGRVKLNVPRGKEQCTVSGFFKLLSGLQENYLDKKVTSAGERECMPRTLPADWSVTITPDNLSFYTLPTVNLSTTTAVVKSPSPPSPLLPPQGKIETNPLLTKTILLLGMKLFETMITDESKWEKVFGPFSKDVSFKEGLYAIQNDRLQILTEMPTLRDIQNNFFFL